VFCRSIRVVIVIRTTAEFSREIAEDVQHINGYFCSYPQVVDDGHDFDMEQLSSELNAAADVFNARGSNFVLDRVLEFIIVVSYYHPLTSKSIACHREPNHRKKSRQ